MSGLAATSADAKRTEAPDAENVALQIAALLAVDPAGLAGVVLRGPAVGGPACLDDRDETLPLCAFDDQGLWLPLVVLQERLVAARRLP